MEVIILPMTIGERKTEVRLEPPHGGPGGYHIMIDKFYHGSVNKMSDGWHVYINSNSFLTAEDFDVILEEVRKRD